MRCAPRGGIETVGWMALAAISLSLAAGPILGQAPPRELKLVGDHWTAWDPPAAIEEGAEVHVIQRGDTLWDLAERFYGNAYLWPQIWERNQYILDAHWIYPGDPLVLGIQVESAELLEEPFSEGQPGEEFKGADQVADAESDIGLFGGRSTFGPLGTPDDIYCSGYLGENRESFPYRVIGSEYEVLGPSLDIKDRGRVSAVFGAVDAIKVGLTAGDIVYLDGGRAGGMVPGDIFSAVLSGERIKHPERVRSSAGRYYSYLGQVRVLSVQQDTAIAEISQSCQPMFIGAMLKPFRREPVPSDRKTPMRPVNEPTSLARLEGAPAILHTKDGVVSVGQDHVVFVELGESDDVEPGDVFTIYRRSIGGRPPIVIGEVAILSVHPMSSVAKIIESRYPVYVGDVLERK